MLLFKPFVYKSSNNRLYYLHGGQNLVNGLKIYSFSEHNKNALNSLPSGYEILERENSGNIPALVSNNHTRQNHNCQWEKILSLAEECDHQFYMSEIGDTKWNEKRKAEIVKMIIELDDISKTVTCSECQKELKWQIELQKNGIENI